MSTLDTIGGAQTKLTRFNAAECGSVELENLAAHIEGGVVPLTNLELSQLCAALCRRLAMLERHVVDPAIGDLRDRVAKLEHGNG